MALEDSQWAIAHLLTYPFQGCEAKPDPFRNEIRRLYRQQLCRPEEELHPQDLYRTGTEYCSLGRTLFLRVGNAKEAG